jgi:ribosomal protein S18 acetylase RimI-like enzyme
MSDFVFERPKKRDRRTIARLLLADMQEQGVPRTEEELLSVSDLLLSTPPDQCFCRVARATKTGPAVGVVIASSMISVKLAGRSVWLEHLYVDSEWRGRRLGRALVELLMDWAEETGKVGIELEAYQGNTPAGILYRSLGFGRLSRERYYFSFRWLDD